MSTNHLIDINKKVIDCYLYDYVTYTKFIDLNKQYNDVTSFKRKIKKFIKNKNNKYEFLNKANVSNIGNLIGGEKLIDKINKIYEVSKIYNSINIDEVISNKEQIDDKLTKLSETISKNFDNTEQVLKIIAESKILNTINVLSMNIAAMKEGFDVIPEAVDLYLPIEEAQVLTPKEDSPSVFITMSKTYREKLNEISKNITHYETEGEGASQLDTLLINIGNNIAEIDKSLLQVDDATNMFKNIVGKFNRSLLFTYEPEDAVKIESIDSLILRLRSLSEATGINEISDFVNRTIPLLETKKIRQNKFVEMYNELVSKLDPSFLATNNLPNPYFNGGYVIRITNNLLLSPSVSESQLSMLGNLVTVSEEDLLYKEFSDKGTKDINIIYNPDFSTFKTTIGGKNKILAGGNPDEVVFALGQFDSKIRDYSDKLSEYNRSVLVYNTIQIHLIMHTLFLTLIATNQILINNYTIYVYINKGILEFFRMILTKINNYMDNDVMSEDIMYMRKYHYVTIKKLLNFVTILSGRMSTKDIIDIRRCKGEAAERFLLLNYFKTVLESYNAMFQNKITIYSRINDIGYTDVSKRDYTKEVFLSDAQYKRMVNDRGDPDLRKMWIQKKREACKDFEDEFTDQSLEFTQVFDTEDFPSNGDISKYMTLDTQLSKRTSIGVMTYGYSGTGKTYTLFGNKAKVNEDGLLQFTIDNINGLLKLKFRAYEIFGYGLAYPHYWIASNGKSRTGDIFNRIYHYNLLLGADSISFNGVEIIESKDIEPYTEHTELIRSEYRAGEATSYIDISSQLSERLLKNFDSFVSEIERHREGKDLVKGKQRVEEKGGFIRRIRDTPNNTVSSRSILVYDFQLYIDDLNKPPVPFLIVDLPGREEIIKTYVDTYIDNDVIKNILLGSPVNDKIDKNNRDPIILYYKFLLSVMCINPLALPIFNGRIVYNTVNKSKGYRDILTKEIPMEFDYIPDPSPKKKASNERTLKSLQEKYIVTPVGKGGYKITAVKGRSGFTFEDELINLRGITVKSLREGLEGKKYISGFGYISSEFNEYQYYATLSIHIMNRLILENKFNIIEDIYRNICKIEINDKLAVYVDGTNGNELFDMLSKLIESRFKGDFIELARSKINPKSQYLKDIVLYIAQKIAEGKKFSWSTYPSSLNNEDLGNLKEDVKELLQFDYYLTPFEGIYINENIIGLIKYLASKMISSEQERRELEGGITKQNLNLNFIFQQKIARMWLISEDIDDTNLIQFYNLKNKSEIARKLFDSYNGELRFNYDNMLNEYNRFKDTYKPDAIFNFENPLIESILKPYIKYIDDYKVFYLFANYENLFTRDMKCANQYRLLDSTEDFIKTITQ